MLQLASLAALALPLVSATVYPRIESWKGDNFIDGFRADPSPYDNTTSGDTFWAAPSNTSIYYPTSSGTFIMKVDNTSFVPYNEKRYAPKLLSKTAYDIGTVWVFDSIHMPYGCSVWPAFWTQGSTWPEEGEIDIIEGINNQAANQVALHADAADCIIDSGTITGTVANNNCSTEANYGAGCVINDANANSYGPGFAAAGGGVYVAEFATDGIRVWFFTRSAVPSSLTADATSIDTASFGTPVAAYLSSGCDISKYFGPQILTINIALCGSWAGQADLLQQTCPPLVAQNTCYTTYVIDDASATYANAYFEINYLNIYSSNGASSSPSSSASASGSARSNSPTTTISAGAGQSGASGASNPTGAGSRVHQQWDGAGLGWVAAIAGGLVMGLGMIL